MPFPHSAGYGHAFSAIFSDTMVLMSRKYDELPWPLLNPQSLDFLTTHGLHCYFESERQVNQKELNWIDRLHLKHCYEEISGVAEYLRSHPNEIIPSFMCNKITGAGKVWHSMPEQHLVDYFNSTTWSITLQELLSKDKEMTEVYSKSGRLYSNYQDGAPTEMHGSLYSNYNDVVPIEGAEKESVVKDRKALYVSQQDIELRMLAGFNYGYIIAKHMTGAKLSKKEQIYINEQEKSTDEWAWTASSFYCTFLAETSQKLTTLMHRMEKEKAD